MKKRAKELENQGLSNTRWKQIFRQGKTKVGLIIVLLFIVVAVFAPVLAPNNPLLVDAAHKLEGPSRSYLLGNGSAGTLHPSRLIWGSRYSLLYSGIVLLLTLLIGVPVGLISGYVGGKLDLFMMRIMRYLYGDAQLYRCTCDCRHSGRQRKKSGNRHVLCIPAYARLTRALTMQVKEQELYAGIKSRGCSHGQIIFKHVLKIFRPQSSRWRRLKLVRLSWRSPGFPLSGWAYSRLYRSGDHAK